DHVLKQVDNPGDKHLRERGLRRWRLYHRSEPGADQTPSDASDTTYEACDTSSKSMSELNVYQTASQIIRWADRAVSSTLANLLRDAPHIHGFTQPYQKLLLS